MAPLLPVTAGLFALLTATLSPAAGSKSPEAPVPPAAVEKVSAEAVSSHCGLIINVARNAKLDAFIQPVAPSADLETKAEAALLKAAQDAVTGEQNKNRDGNPTGEQAKKKTCKFDAKTAPKAGMDGLLLPLNPEKKSGSSAAFDCSAIIASLVSKGLEKLKGNAAKPYDYNDSPYDTNPAGSFAPLFYAESTQFGCVKTKDCDEGNDALYCMFSPPLPQKTVPFTEEYFAALEKRKADGVDLTKLTKDDIRTSGVSGASLGIPAVIISLAALFYL